MFLLGHFGPVAAVWQPTSWANWHHHCPACCTWSHTQTPLQRHEGKAWWHFWWVWVCQVHEWDLSHLCLECRMERCVGTRSGPCHSWEKCHVSSHTCCHEHLQKKKQRYLNLQKRQFRVGFKRNILCVLIFTFLTSCNTLCNKKKTTSFSAGVCLWCIPGHQNTVTLTLRKTMRHSCSCTPWSLSHNSPSHTCSGISSHTQTEGRKHTLKHSHSVSRCEPRWRHVLVCKLQLSFHVTHSFTKHTNVALPWGWLIPL